jgi:PAS domain S-box-containing protein
MDTPTPNQKPALKNRLRFSTVLMVTIMVLVLVSVVLLLGVLTQHFSERVEQEFQNKLWAQKGQVEILLRNRLVNLQKILKDLSSDNSIRVTVMLGAGSQLQDHILQSYPPRNGVYHFIQRYGDPLIYPESYPGITSAFVAATLKRMSKGDVADDGTKDRLIWLFSNPIMHVNGRMGTAYILYDLTEDRQLIESIAKAVEGNLCFLSAHSLASLTGGDAISLSENQLENLPESASTAFNTIVPNFVLSRLSESDRLFFLYSLKKLNREKQKVTLLMGLLSALVLVVSMVISILLSRKMVRPLRDMTRKAIRISNGQKELQFDEDVSYWEFDRLSQAFNTMLINLKEAEERSRYKELLENVDDAVYILDEKGKVLDANTAAYSTLGYAPDRFYGLQLETIVPEKDARIILAQLPVAPDRPNLKKLSLETIHRRSDGGTIPVEILSRPITYRGRSVILNVARDISRRMEVEEEKKQLEAQLFHAQKMEAIGTLAGGIAHDFNNLLMGIQGRIAMIRLKADARQALKKHLDSIEKTVMSASNLTRQLLGFARKGKYEAKPACLNALVEDSTNMFIRTRKEIHLTLNCSPDLLPVNVDRGQIEQVLINLYVNAWHAMPEGGELVINTENVRLTDAFCRPYEVPPGDYVMATISDTGVGMDPETMERIFEPFFTTKGPGKGTGLGLASAYGIIRNHKGIIQVASRKGEGATFTIYLPAANPADRKEAAAAPANVQGKGAVLIVDDEEESLLAEEMMLRELGYEVITALNGDDAVRLYRENAPKLVLVTIDMIMPGLSGKEVYQQLKAINPDVKVLLISGYSHGRQMQEMMADGCNGYVQKPYDLPTLSHKIDEALAAPPSSSRPDNRNGRPNPSVPGPPGTDSRG